jgi:hypothetical protein
MMEICPVHNSVDYIYGPDFWHVMLIADVELYIPV